MAFAEEFHGYLLNRSPLACGSISFWAANTKGGNGKGFLCSWFHLLKASCFTKIIGFRVFLVTKFSVLQILLSFVHWCHYFCLYHYY